MMIYKDHLLKDIKQSFLNYQKHGARSSKKLLPFHGYIASVIQNIWGAGFQVHQMENKELKVVGKYYDKNIDIAVTDKKRISLFFV